jgi:hypothetical protein
VHKIDQPLFQPIVDLEPQQISFGRVALLGDAAYVARPHVARGAIKAGHDAIALADALANLPAEDALRKYDAVRRPANVAIVAESRRLRSYIEGKGERAADPVQFMQENGGVEPSLVDGGCGEYCTSFLRNLSNFGFNSWALRTQRIRTCKMRRPFGLLMRRQLSVWRSMLGYRLTQSVSA